MEKSHLLTYSRMIAIACVCLTVFHPGYFFPPFAAFRLKGKQ